MRIVGIYSFKDGKAVVESQYPSELQEIRAALAAVDCMEHRTKVSREKTMPGKALYSPRSLNSAIKKEFAARHRVTYRVLCDYSAEFYDTDYLPQASRQGLFERLIL